ncbi:E3 ubiquitin-protein ligase At1g63170-like [Typha latifolia]|uniref:E3 ubiquitin-protein ligase At1g63170-like n=1 Tax=Typha latifolia TaxID=4733 RepID=UPI003C2FF01A
MEASAQIDGHEHVINIAKASMVTASTSDQDCYNYSDGLHCEDRPSTSTQAPASSSSSSSSSPVASNSRNVHSNRGGENYGRHQRSPMNSGLWISIEFLVNVSQIIAAIVVLSLSRHEHPRAPLFAWVIGYTAGCVATLPYLCWRYIHFNGQDSGEELDETRQNSFPNDPAESTSYTSITSAQAVQADHRSTEPVSQLASVITSPRIHALFDHFKMVIDCFFAVWFVVGNVWIFGGSSSTDAPNLYRLCIVLLTVSFIGYAVPFILCVTIFCCLPCMMSILGFREDSGRSKGASAEVINALPTYKFKLKRGRNRGNEIISNNLREGGILGPGTNKERIISAEDAVCTICLAEYSDNDELRELPCYHFFHLSCVDKWLKISAICPLCKFQIGFEAAGSVFGAQFSRRRGNRRLGRGVDSTRVAVV